MISRSTALPSPAKKTGRVLIVDDTPTHRSVLSQLLCRKGYEVYQADNGPTALALAKAHQPAVILLAIMLPGMDGYQVSKHLRNQEETATISIIFLSDPDAPFDKMKAFRLGAADYLTKPFQAEEVLARVGLQIKLQRLQQKQQQLHAALENREQERTQKLTVAHQQLLAVAFKDQLTRLPNRLSFIERLRGVMTQALSYPETYFAVLVLDCDRFKRINDSLGHSIGDQILKGIGNRLTKLRLNHPAIDLVARFGGDEFALLLTHLTDRNTVTAIADAVLAAIAQPFALNGHDITITASIGLVWGESSYENPDYVLRDADMAMYRAKDCCHSQYRWFKSAMHARAVQLLQLETDFRLALERKEFELHYQPIVDLKRLEIIGFEALVRWQHPTRGLIGPNDFIGFAEDNDFIVQLGEQVLTMACTHVAQWERAGILSPHITVSVNIDAQQLLQSDILKQVSDIIESTGIEAHRLHLELTERSIINSSTFIDGVLRALQQRNIQLSIDDFGTGYSALSYLHTLPVNCLKIDRSFVQLITAQPDSLGIVPLIIKIAQTMEMTVIAEGIENITQLRQLKQLGCTYGQGYLFQKAVPAAQVIDLLTHPVIPWDTTDTTALNDAPETDPIGPAQKAPVTRLPAIELVKRTCLNKLSGETTCQEIRRA